MKEKKYQHPTKALSEICTVTSKIFSVQLQLNIVRTSSSNLSDSSEDLRIIPSLLFQPSFPYLPSLLMPRCLEVREAMKWFKLVEIFGDLQRWQNLGSFEGAWKGLWKPRALWAQRDVCYLITHSRSDARP